MIPAPRGGGRVVVGYDGSWHARAAVERATDEATSRGLPLQVVTLVGSTPDPDLVPRAQRERDRRDLEEAAQHLADAVAGVRERQDAPQVWGTLVNESDRARLADLLLGCRLLVVGDRGRLERRAFVVGSASDDLWRATQCPVLVVPGGSASRAELGPVLAGVDGRPGTREILTLAADEAARRGGRLEIVHAYRTVRGADAEQVVAAARHTCDHQVAAAQLRPDVVVTRVVTSEDPATALLARASGASLVVVGTRGALGLAGLVAGSVSRAVLAAAPCPVLLVPADARGDLDDRAGQPAAAPADSR